MIITVQRRRFDTVAAYSVSIPKCNDYSLGAPTLLRVQKCLFKHNCQRSVGGEKLVWRIFFFILFRTFFIDYYEVLVGFGRACAHPSFWAH
jgi:hypothetical protein